MPLFGLRWVGPHDLWGFAIYLASKDGYEESVLPSGHFRRPQNELWSAPARLPQRICVPGIYQANVFRHRTSPDAAWPMASRLARPGASDVAPPRAELSR